VVFFFKQKTAYEILAWLEFRRVLFRSTAGHSRPRRPSRRIVGARPRTGGPPAPTVETGGKARPPRSLSVVIEAGRFPWLVGHAALPPTIPFAVVKPIWKHWEFPVMSRTPKKAGP